MESISTSFNKNDMNICTDRCILALYHKKLTPDELNCIQRYFGSLFRCTRNIHKPVNSWQRTRTDSEEFNLKLTDL